MRGYKTSYRPIHFTHSERILKPRPSVLFVRVMPFSKWRVKVIGRFNFGAFCRRPMHKRHFVRVTRGLKRYDDTGRKYIFSGSRREY